MTVPPANLDGARRHDRELRARLAEVITAERVARQEAARLTDRASLAGADPDVGKAAERQRARATALAREIDEIRTAIRRQEGVIVTLEAAADEAAPASSSEPGHSAT